MKLALIDDGFDVKHPDLSPNVIAKKDFQNNAYYDMYNSDDYHGTSCAGVAGAAFGGGKTVGSCPNCSLILARSTKYLDTDSVLNHFNWVISQGAQVISNSWGPSGYMELPSAVKSLFKSAAEDGIIILFAAGNENERVDGQNYDGFAASEYVICVGASGAEGVRADYSDYGSVMDIMAPSSSNARMSVAPIITIDQQNGGSDLLSGQSIYDYTFFGGTSSAAPLAAGIVALLKGVNPGLGFDEIYTILATTSDHIGGVSYDSGGFNTYYGYGRINAYEAVKKAFVEECSRDGDCPRRRNLPERHLCQARH